MNRTTQHAGTPPRVIVHLDMKGVLFKPTYFRTLMADLASQGVDAVLAEYEDIFPFSGLDITYVRSDRWTQGVLGNFLAAARDAGIEIIPLQQCLGHLEYLFRWDQFRQFAEDRNYPSTLCLSNSRGKALVADMLCQVMAAHPESQYVHLGMDEAKNLASCSRCRRKGDTLTVFLDYLDELCGLCDNYGKTPIIWTDMLEDHFRPGLFARFKNRIVMAPWDYGAHGRIDLTSRIVGHRVSRYWLDHADDPSAPAIGTATPFIEDLAPAVARATKPYRRGAGFTPIFQARLWSDMGFRVLGACAVRSSAHLAVLPDYNLLRSNISTWSGIVRSTRQFGLLGTSWARGTTFCPPSFIPDLAWPNIAYLARQMGRRPRPFWPGLPAKTLDRILCQLGRCRKDWRLERTLIDTMIALRPRIREHLHEWDSLILMTRVLALHRRAEFAVLEVEFFHGNTRPVDSEWRRRLDDQAAILKDLRRLRTEVRTHFGRRYRGDAYREWIRDLFDLWEAKLRRYGTVASMKCRRAARQYGQRSASQT